MMSEHCEPTSVPLKAARQRSSRARANSKRRQGSRRPIESVSAEAGKYLGANFEPLSRSEDDNRSDHDKWSKPNEERMKGTAMPRYATTRQTMIDRIVDPVMAVMMFTGMGMAVRNVIHQMMFGSGGHACLDMRIFQGHDTGELSDHEQADQKWNNLPKGPKPLHRSSLGLPPTRQSGRDQIARQCSVKSARAAAAARCRRR
jgi:hypothetical protein